MGSWHISRIPHVVFKYSVVIAWCCCSDGRAPSEGMAVQTLVYVCLVCSAEMA